MARKDRMITQKEEIIKIIDACKVLRIAMWDEGEIYILPMNYGYTYENGELVFYLHGALEGRKTDVLRKCGRVGFELDCNHELIQGKMPCQYGYKFASVTGNGTAVILEDSGEKIEAMQILMRHMTGKEFEFNERLLSIVTMIKIKADKFSGRKREK